MYEQVEEESIRKGNVSERQAQFKQKSLYISLRSKRFQSSYCAKVRAEAKKRLKGEGKGRRGNACPQTPILF